VAIPVVGMGGIASAEDALEFILVGRARGAGGTANFTRPDFAFRLVEELPPLLERLGVGSWEEFRGTLRAYRRLRRAQALDDVHPRRAKRRGQSPQYPHEHRKPQPQKRDVPGQGEL
jgi:hypothetical protein